MDENEKAAGAIPEEKVPLEVPAGTEEADSAPPEDEDNEPLRRPALTGAGGGARKGKQHAKPEPKRPALTPEQRLNLLFTWQKSGLPVSEFARLTGVTKHTLFNWKHRFEQFGPAGLMDKQRGVKPGSKLPDLTKRTILMLKEANPDWGCERISDMLARGPALPASPNAVARVLKEAGYEVVEGPTRPHPDKVRSFERATSNQLWQTDLFTFLLKRQNRRVYLVAFMDDHSRFIVGYGLHASQSGALVLEVLRACLASHGAPQEILTDNGTQYVTWRGKSQFTKELEKRGIKQVVARPRHPQTLGKIERFWGSLWRECVETAVFLDLEDARRRIGQFIDHYNFQRPHQGIEGLVPADRFFGAAPEVLKTLKARVAENALELARSGIPKKPFYVTGQVGGKSFSLHAEGERVILTPDGGERQEVDLAPPESRVAVPEPVTTLGALPGSFAEAPEPEPGTSPIDELTATPEEKEEDDDEEEGGES